MRFQETNVSESLECCMISYKLINKEHATKIVLTLNTADLRSKCNKDTKNMFMTTATEFRCPPSEADSLIGVLRRFQQLFSHITAASSPTHVFPCFPTINFSNNWLLFDRLYAYWWKTNDLCRIDFNQMTERMLAELGFKLTTDGLTAHVATD